jgi:hypothetical protein
VTWFGWFVVGLFVVAGGYSFKYCKGVLKNVDRAKVYERDKEGISAIWIGVSPLMSIDGQVCCWSSLVLLALAALVVLDRSCLICLLWLDWTASSRLDDGNSAGT